MAMFDWLNRRAPATFSEPRSDDAQKPSRDETIHEALVDLSVVVHAMDGSDPTDPNWQKYMGDFNEAVKSVRKAVRSFEPDRGHEEEHDASRRSFTRKGNAIDIESSGQWIEHDSGMCASRAHIGRSIEGVHGGLEVSLGKGAVAWGEARAEEAEARRDASRMREDWREFPPFETHYTRHNNFIDPIWADGWRGEAHCVSNERVGLSDEGFHGGVTTSWKNGDLETYWGPARETFGRAQDDATAMRVTRTKDMDREVERIEASRDDGWDR